VRRFVLVILYAYALESQKAQHRPGFLLANPCTPYPYKPSLARRPFISRVRLSAYLFYGPTGLNQLLLIQLVKSWRDFVSVSPTQGPREDVPFGERYS
jgi:hypothetical protein